MTYKMWISMAFIAIGLLILQLTVEKASRGYIKPSKASGQYTQLLMPIFKATGEIDSDLVAESAVWNRKTGEITFKKPVMYRYLNGKCVQILSGDAGKTDVAGRTNITVWGNVKVRSYKEQK